MHDSGFRREADKNCTLLRYYAASIGNFLQIGCPVTLVRNYHYSLRNNAVQCTSQILPA